MTWVYDLECGINFFSAVYYNPEHNEMREFYHLDDYDVDQGGGTRADHIAFLRENVKRMVGFNNVGYDGRLLEYFVKYPRMNASGIYLYSQSLIENSDERVYPNRKFFLPQLDLYLIHHFNNKHRKTSLKWVGFFIRDDDLQDIPFHHNMPVDLSEVPEIMRYNRHDVLLTTELYRMSSEQIKLRSALREQYGMECMNWSDSKIGEELMLKLYAERAGVSARNLREQRTARASVNLYSVVSKDVSRSKAIDQWLADTTIDPLAVEKDVHYSERVGDITLDYGLGGVHGVNAGAYYSNDTHIIIDLDIASMYPSIAVTLGIYPQHLGASFTEVYASIIDQRLQAKRMKNFSTSDALKLALNSVYGKSKSEYSWLYDPAFTYGVTINGQLLLSDVIRRVQEATDCVTIQANTDGFTVYIRREQVSVLMSTIVKWEKESSLVMESDVYDSMVLRDVNNYIAVTESRQIKAKGAFEYDKRVGKQWAFHKNNSARIVPIALARYFIDSIPVEETIRTFATKTGQKFELGDEKVQSHGIYDYCLISKARKGWTHQRFYPEDGKLQVENLSKHLRYYVTTKGDQFYKVSDNGNKSILEKHPQSGRVYRLRDFMTYLPQDDYEVDYSYYERAARSIIRSVIDTQGKLF